MTTGFPTRSAEAYEQMMGRWSASLAAAIMARLPRPLAGSFIDVGCGTGSLVAELMANPAVERVTGVDYSRPYVAFASSRFANDPRVSIEEGDACALRHDDATFDGALSLLVLKFVTDPGRAAREMVRVVKPGGLVCAAVWDVYGGFVWNRLFWDTAVAVEPLAVAPRNHHFALPLTRPGELGTLWREMGLVDVVEQDITVRMTFKDFKDFWAPLGSGEGVSGALVASLPESSAARLKQAVFEAYAAGRADGERSFTATALCCWGYASI